MYALLSPKLLISHVYKCTENAQYDSSQITITSSSTPRNCGTVRYLSLNKPKAHLISLRRWCYIKAICFSHVLVNIYLLFTDHFINNQFSKFCKITRDTRAILILFINHFQQFWRYRCFLNENNRSTNSSGHS